MVQIQVFCLGVHGEETLVVFICSSHDTFFVQVLLIAILLLISVEKYKNQNVIVSEKLILYIHLHCNIIHYWQRVLNVRGDIENLPPC